MSVFCRIIVFKKIPFILNVSSTISGFYRKVDFVFSAIRYMAGKMVGYADLNMWKHCTYLF